MDRSYATDVDWLVLCEQASKEQDPKKLIKLVQHLSEVLEDRRRRQAQDQLSTHPDAVSEACETRGAGLSSNY